MTCIVSSRSIEPSSPAGFVLAVLFITVGGNIPRVSVVVRDSVVTVGFRWLAVIQGDDDTDKRANMAGRRQSD